MTPVGNFSGAAMSGPNGIPAFLNPENSNTIVRPIHTTDSQMECAENKIPNRLSAHKPSFTNA